MNRRAQRLMAGIAPGKLLGIMQEGWSRRQIADTLATNRTGTMQDELNEAGARGYRFAGTQGGATAFGGREAVVIMALDPEGRRFRYILLSTNRTGTMQREMNEAPPEYNFAGMTVFSSTFGGSEAAVILEAEVTDD